MNAPRPREISGKLDTKLRLLALITILGLPADIDEIIILLVLGGLFLVPIAYFFVLEIKRAKLKTIE